MSDEVIEFEVRTVGADKAAADFERIDTSMSKLDKNSRKAGKGVGALADVAGNLGQAMRSAGDGSATFSSKLNMAGDAAAALASAFGAPTAVAGAAIGLTSLVNAYVDSQRAAAQATRDATESIEDQRKEVNKLASAFKAQGLSSLDSEEAGLSLAFDRNQVSFGERERRQGIIDRKRLEIEDAEIEADNDARLKAIEDAERGAFGDVGGKGRKGRKGRGRKKKDGFGSMISGLAGDESAEDFVRRTEGEDIDADMEALDEHEKAMAQLYSDKFDFMEAEAKERDKILEAERKEREKAEEKSLAHTLRMEKQRKAAIFGSFEIVGRAGVQAFADLAKGQEVSMAAVISGIGDAMVAEGARFFFSGLGEIWMGNPKGVGLMQVGAMEMGAGIAMGAAMSVPAGASAGGGGGGGGGGGRRRASEPTRFGGGGEDGGTTIINVHQPAVVQATPETGEAITRNLEAFERIRGRRAVARRVG